MWHVFNLYSMGGQLSPTLWLGHSPLVFSWWKSGPTSPPEMLALQTMDLKLRRSPFDHQSFVGFAGFVGFDWGRSGASQVGWTFPTLGCLNWIRNQNAKKIRKSERPTKDILFVSVNLLGFCGEGSACPQISRGFTFRWSPHFLRGPSYSNSMMYSGYTWLCWKTMNSRGASLFGYAIRECLSSGIKPSKNDSSV